MQREEVLRMLRQLTHSSGSIVEEMWPEADARASVVRYVRCEQYWALAIQLTVGYRKLKSATLPALEELVAELDCTIE